MDSMLLSQEVFLSNCSIDLRTYHQPNIGKMERAVP